MAGNVELQLIQSVKKNLYYALQIHETPNVTNNAQLICYVRYAHGDYIHDDIMFYRKLITQRTEKEIFHSLDSYIQDKGIQWEKSVGFCLDGGHALGRHSGDVSRVKEVVPDLNWVHCFIHREALATKGMPPDFENVLDITVNLVNFIKARLLNKGYFPDYAMKCTVNIHFFCFNLQFAGFPVQINSKVISIKTGSFVCK